MRRAEFFEQLEHNKVRCTLCPHYCILSENQTGLCLGKKNIGGELIAVNYEKVLTIADDPIEKKPLYHFHPGTMIISTAQYGCNLRCPFCQNYDISQRYEETASLPIEGLYNILKSKNRKSIAFTYTEPLMWYEYILDFGKKYSKEIEIVLVTNATLNEEPLKMIIPYIKAVNVDLKSFSKDFYKRELKGDLEIVKNAIRLFHSESVHLEITNLLIPGKNDNPYEFREMTDFIASVSDDIPLHISRYFPNFKYSL
ncbi:MAG: radical SAM protein, partial [bacterium]